MSAPAVPLFAYQRDWFLDRSRFKAAMYARQTGKTFTTTLEVVDDCFEAAVTGRRERWVILSRGERQAKEAIDEGVKRHAQAYGMVFEAAEFEWRGETGGYKALEVTLPGGSRITALPANPDTARGFSANVFLDEFAFHRDSRTIWKALFPVISAGWKLRVTSTPNGKDNKFYEIMTGGDPIWSRHVVDIHRAVADGLPRDVEELRRAIDDEDAWAQEFELKWLDEASAWLSYDLISSCEEETAGRPELSGGGVCFVGWDIAVRKDLSVIVVVEKIGDVLWVREMIEMRRVSLTEQYDVFSDVMRRHLVGRACLDQTGMGEGAVAETKRRHGLDRIEGVLFTGPTKLVLATAGKQAFEDRTIRIPMGHAALRADLHKLRRVASATGAPRFVAERDEDHADRTWALFLAIHAADAGAQRIEYRSAAADLDDGGSSIFDPVGRDTFMPNLGGL